jgi:hypothetical protein
VTQRGSPTGVSTSGHVPVPPIRQRAFWGILKARVRLDLGLDLPDLGRTLDLDLDLDLDLGSGVVWKVFVSCLEAPRITKSAQLTA